MVHVVISYLQLQQKLQILWKVWSYKIFPPAHLGEKLVLTAFQCPLTNPRLLKSSGLPTMHDTALQTLLSVTSTAAAEWGHRNENHFFVHLLPCKLKEADSSPPDRQFSSLGRLIQLFWTSHSFPITSCSIRCRNSFEEEQRSAPVFLLLIFIAWYALRSC